jgi:hypothetical protein|tara:strand:- start:255 stop:458 length:204 start_codon:yes stop_codon:yes gene_type:complete
MGNKSNRDVVQKQRRSMIETFAMYAQVIIALGIVMIVWQLEKAGKLLILINRFLAEAITEHGEEKDE